MKKFESKPQISHSGGNNDALESLLRNARADGFTRPETEQVWSRLGLVLGARADLGGLNSSTGSLPPKALGVLGAKTKVALLLCSGVVVAGLAAMGIAGGAFHRAPPAAEKQGRATATANGPGSPSMESPSGGTLGGLGDVDNPFSGLTPTGIPAAASAAQSPNPPLPKRIESAARPSVETRASVPKAAQPAGVDERAGDPTIAESPKSKDVPAPEAQPSAPIDQVLNEGAILLRARRALGSNPTDTLRLTEEHSRFFPAGTLSPERDVLAIEAFVRLGRLPEARARFAAFRARYPQSPHLARLEGLVGR